VAVKDQIIIYSYY